MPFPETPHLGAVPAILHITPAALPIAAGVQEQPTALITAALAKLLEIGGSEQTGCR